MMRLSKSEQLFQKAEKVAIGGVHDQLRFYSPFPLSFQWAKGSKLYDLDGNEYIDYHLAFGPVILGHCHPKVVEAVKEQAEKGELYGSPYEEEYKVSEKIVRYFPSAEKVRFCNAGSDATFHAIRLARAYTKRKKIIKFEGCYHGWHDYTLVSVMPPADKVGSVYPESDGILPEAMENTIVVPFNDLDAFEKSVRENKEKLAAVILEPIQHNIGCIMPKEGYLKALREITERYDIPLIFDEVITGFRHDLGGCQRIFGVTPDLTTLAKAMANGYPLAALCGREEIMRLLKPSGDVFMAGTYYSHPIAVAAALATIEELEKEEAHEHMMNLGDMIRKELSKIIEDLNLKAQISGFRSIFTIYFTDSKLKNYTSLLNNDSKLYARYNQGMKNRGIFFHPHPLKRCHLSAAHTKKDAKKFITAAEEILSNLAK